MHIFIRKQVPQRCIFFLLSLIIFTKNDWYSQLSLWKNKQTTFTVYELCNFNIFTMKVYNMTLKIETCFSVSLITDKFPQSVRVIEIKLFVIYTKKSDKLCIWAYNPLNDHTWWPTIHIIVGLINI